MFFQERLAEKLKSRYERKLRWIRKSQRPADKERMQAPLICYDGINPPECIKTILRKGPMFVPGSYKLTPEAVMPGVEDLIRNLSETRKEYFRWKAHFWMRRYNLKKHGKEAEYMNALRKSRKWLRENNIVFLRADKNRALVLMKRNSYTAILQKYIRDTECEEIGKDFVDKTQSRVHRFTRTGLARKLQLDNATVTSPMVPRLFAYAKTHKQGIELRPILDKANAPARMIERKIHLLLSKHLEGYQFTVSDSTQMIEAICNCQPSPGAWITILDFKAMYPSIKLEPCFCGLRDWLMEEVTGNADHKQILELAHILCYTSCFQLDGKVYLQKRGVPMGSPLSGDLAEMIVRRLEAKVIPEFLDNIGLYKRYIDDICIIWKKKPDIDRFVCCMNDNPYGLLIELVQMSDEAAHFLDINITFSDGSCDTNVYRKPNAIPIYIPADSNDPYSYKLAAFRALTRRALTHCNRERDKRKEIGRIAEIAENHGYSKKLILSIAEEQERNPVNQPDAVRENNRQQGMPPRLVVITYERHLHSLYREIGAYTNTKIAYKRKPDVFSLLRNGKDPVDVERAPGVYRIPLRDHRFGRDLVYIGSTKRSLGQRIREHKTDIEKKKTNTALAVYASENGITPGLQRATLIRRTRQAQHLKYLEALEIFKADSQGLSINFKDEIQLSKAWQAMYDPAL
ncbi:uncharacterized protein [Centruroides vittatus]|uniref:uncharacterized protein n=1 Tax=Centruroides vittatus TaxID=120091 RepID=UPI00350FC662